MVLQLSEPLRRAICAAAVMAYVLPAVLGALTLVGHTVEHLADEAQEQSRIAASLGLTHSSEDLRQSDSPSDTGLPAAAMGGNAVVHTHGGSTHAHEGPVSDLIRITGQVDGTLTIDASVSTQIAGHVPAYASVVSFADFTNAPSGPVVFSAVSDPHASIWLPPPRA